MTNQCVSMQHNQETWDIYPNVYIYIYTLYILLPCITLCAPLSSFHQAICGLNFTEQRDLEGAAAMDYADDLSLVLDAFFRTAFAPARRASAPALLPGVPARGRRSQTGTWLLRVGSARRSALAPRPEVWKGWSLLHFSILFPMV